MKVSEITVSDVAEFMNLEEGEYSRDKISYLLEAAKEYVSDYTGIPQKTEETEEKTLDDYQKFPFAVMVVCQDMYDNPAFYVEKSNVNKVVDSILHMHRRNLVG